MSSARVQSKPAGYELKDELARFCLPATNRDSTRKLAWVNSLCVFFLLVGIVGNKPGKISIKAPPPVEEIIPVVLETQPPPSVKIEAQQNPEPNEAKADVQKVVVVTPEAPNINFAIPTIGNLVVPNALAQAPPAAPLRELSSAKAGALAINSTGTGGERPAPPYPGMARNMGQQGTVLLSMTTDGTGLITSIEIKQSSGFPILDRATLDYVRRHWILPAGTPGQVYEAPIRFILSQ